jgi:hypothetical protein
VRPAVPRVAPPIAPRISAAAAASASASGVWHLGDALIAFAGRGLQPYVRVSVPAGAGKGGKVLERKAAALEAALQAAAPGRRVWPCVYGVERGQLTREDKRGKRSAEPRPALVKAASRARKANAVLVAADVTRLIRAEGYDRQGAWDAVPTAAEFEALRERTYGVPLATLVHPDTAASERHSRATRRTKRAGRPRLIDDDLAAEVVACLGSYSPGDSGRFEWEVPIAATAELFRMQGYPQVTADAIKKLLNRKSPDGRPWRERGIDAAVERGWLVREPDGGLGFGWRLGSGLPRGRGRIAVEDVRDWIEGRRDDDGCAQDTGEVAGATDARLL